MTKGLGVWMIGYGIFLFLCGAAALLLTPNQPPVPVLAGAICGGIAAFFGVLLMNGTSWAYKAAMFTVVIFMMFGLALSMQHWLLYYKGQPALYDAMISVLVFIGSATALWKLKTKRSF